jgi:hypothetical protein
VFAAGEDLAEHAGELLWAAEDVDGFVAPGVALFG